LYQLKNNFLSNQDPFDCWKKIFRLVPMKSLNKMKKSKFLKILMVTGGFMQTVAVLAQGGF